ncbi:LigA [metagenome]|uniref:LigA n=1 Tax=metagenome TaxID=256318 RepID=A0A2P2CBF2_9ZZZZ
MLWRVRTTLPDRPGSLAVLARHCGEAGVNILGLQIFPGVDGVTDELVLRTPAGWGMAEIAELIEAAGGLSVTGSSCTEHALVDQPTRYVQAARTILAHPSRFPEVVAHLFDAEADPAEGVLAPAQDVMEMRVGDIGVQVRRTAPFTPTEHARGASMADLVTEVLARQVSLSESFADHAGNADSPLDYVVDEDGIAAWSDGSVVGIAMIRSEGSGMVEPGARAVSLRVDPHWQRRGIGTRLLNDVARLAAGIGVQEIVLTTRADNQAVLPMVLAAGLRGRIRMASDILTVRIPVRDLKPLPV